jgi:16S rRNA (guanine527-N7)-methyltransferase
LLPLAITNPDVQFTGIDSVKKKTVAVNEMIAALHIKNATVVWSRIEAYTSQTFDYLTARAVAYVDTLIAWSYPLVKKGGIFLLMKQSLPEERKVLLKACHQRKLHLLKEHTYTLFPGDIERVIYVIQKT